MSEPSSTSTTESKMLKAIFDAAEIHLHDFQFARNAADDRDRFTHEFIGAIAAATSQTPEGRKAWADALKAVTR